MPAARTKHYGDRQIAGPRVVLRPMTEDDIAGVERWYAEAAAAVRGLPEEREGIQALHYQLEAAQADPDAGLLAIVRRGDPAPIGLLDYRGNNPGSGWLTVRFIGVGRAHRGLGYGSEAVRLLEAEAWRRLGAKRFRAGVDMRNGLGLYFWLRLGYRPAALSGGAGEALAMVREAR